ncbi:MAG TPA: hypothetical protein VH436_28610 [Vicinamibacterales bacterium]
MRSDTRAFRSALSIVLAWTVALLGVAVTQGTLTLAQKTERHAGQPGPRFYPDDPVWVDPDTRDIPPIAAMDLSKSYEFIVHTFSDPARSEGPALNVNSLGEVPDSSWFTNRIGVRDMRIAEIVKGPDSVEGPAPGPWLVTGRPDAGITPKFTIKDSRGDTYMIKLDPARFPELPSSVEVISTKIFHAIGYWVPEDTIVHFSTEQLRVAEGATLRVVSGDKRPIEKSDVEQWLKDQPRAADGTIRALASRFVPGKVVGQFRFTGTRSDDPNDIFPHERRRELRGMRVFAAWLNHDDARSINSIDTYVTDEGRRYVRHYLQDFGSNLGSGSTSAQQPRGGNEYLIDKSQIGKGLAGLGFYTRDWTRVKYPTVPSLGNIEADFFDPAKWKTEYPNPAFIRMDAADAFWAASIVSRFSDEMIRAIVDTGELSDTNAARQLGDIIIKRRDKVVAYWMTRTNPLDRFRVSMDNDDPRLLFDNAALRLGLASGAVTYDIDWASLDNSAGVTHVLARQQGLEPSAFVIPLDAFGPADVSGARFAVATIRTHHAGYPDWQSPITVTVRASRGSFDVAGVERVKDSAR